MSIFYSFNVLLNVNFSKENIEKIFERGKILGFCFYKNFWQKEVFDMNQILEDILFIHNNKENINNSYIEIKYKNTFMFFTFSSDSEGLLFLGMSPSTGSEWRVDDKSRIDEERYKNLLRDLVKDFEIIDLEFSEFY